MVRLLDSMPAETRPRATPARARPLRVVAEMLGYVLLAVGVYFGLRFALTFSRLDYL